MNDVTEWLLEGPLWVQYRTRLDLLGQFEDDPEVCSARQAMLAHPQISGLLGELAEWPGPVHKNHKAAGHPLHKLTFMADLGLRVNDPGMDQIVGRIMAHQAREDPFQVLVNIKPGYGGTGEDQWAWMLCDTSLVIYALAKFGLGEDPGIQTAIRHLVGLTRENGWSCAVARVGQIPGAWLQGRPLPLRQPGDAQGAFSSTTVA